MTRRAFETLCGGVIGAALGFVVWIVGRTYYPVEPFDVGRWTFGMALLAGTFSGALVVFFAYERDTPEWRRRVATISIAVGVLAVLTGAVASGHTVEHYGGEVWATGFGAPRCCDCQARTRADCLRILTTPSNVLDRWGELNVRMVSLLMAASAVVLAIGAAVLGSLLAVTRALEKTRVRQFEAGVAVQSFEKIIRPQNPTIDFARFEAALVCLRRRVCRIQFGHEPIGTGFLIGPDLVMTNHHVVAQVLTKTVAAEVVRCVFDVVSHSSAPPREVKLAPEWDVLHSPPSVVDVENDPKGRDPSIDELDFAVIRLAEPVGAEAGKGETRGWVRIPDSFFAQRGDPLVIAQHPRGRALEIAIDTEAILSVNDSGTRVRYRTNTEPGSSGSPCFDMSLETLIAVHHSGDRRFRPAYNEGIPVHRIHHRLTAAGVLCKTSLPVS